MLSLLLEFGSLVSQSPSLFAWLNLAPWIRFEWLLLVKWVLSDSCIFHSFFLPITPSIAHIACMGPFWHISSIWEIVTLVWVLVLFTVELLSFRILHWHSRTSVKIHFSCHLVHYFPYYIEKSKKYFVLAFLFALWNWKIFHITSIGHSRKDFSFSLACIRFCSGCFCVFLLFAIAWKLLTFS